MVAGGLCPEDLALRIGSPRKALAPFGDSISLGRVLQAVEDSKIGPCVTVSGDDLAPYITFGDLIPEHDSAVDNAIAGSEFLNVDRVLVLPADLPLLTGRMVRAFIERLDDRIIDERWFAAGLCTLRRLHLAYPEVEAVPLNLRSGRVLSGGLFATTPDGLHHGRELFNQVRHSRKSQFKMVSRFGFGALTKYFLRLMTLNEAESRLSKVLEGQVILDPDCEPETVLDFDTVADYDQLLGVLPKG